MSLQSITKRECRGRKKKLTDQDISDIRDIYETTSCSMTQIGKRFGVSQPTIAKVIEGKY